MSTLTLRSAQIRKARARLLDEADFLDQWADELGETDMDMLNEGNSMRMRADSIRRFLGASA